MENEIRLEYTMPTGANVCAVMNLDDYKTIDYHPGLAVAHRRYDGRSIQIYGPAADKFVAAWREFHEFGKPSMLPDVQIDISALVEKGIVSEDSLRSMFPGAFGDESEDADG